eukprot:scaffold139115_cov17-Tisochrysis_lutea.AAC.1
MGSPGSHPPACLTSRDGWALYQEHISGGLWGWSGVQKITQFGRELARNQGSTLKQNPLLKTALSFDRAPGIRTSTHGPPNLSGHVQEIC